MVNQVCAGPECSLSLVKSTAAKNGQQPNIKFNSLYLPVRRIIHLLYWGEETRTIDEGDLYAYPANTEPVEMQILLGNKWRPNIFNKRPFSDFVCDIPAADAEESITV